MCRKIMLRRTRANRFICEFSDEIAFKLRSYCFFVYFFFFGKAIAWVIFTKGGAFLCKTKLKIECQSYAKMYSLDHLSVSGH